MIFSNLSHFYDAIVNEQPPAVIFIFCDAPTDLVCAAMDSYSHYSENVRFIWPSFNE